MLVVAISAGRVPNLISPMTHVGDSYRPEQQLHPFVLVTLYGLQLAIALTEQHLNANCLRHFVVRLVFVVKLHDETCKKARRHCHEIFVFSIYNTKCKTVFLRQLCKHRHNIYYIYECKRRVERREGNVAVDKQDGTLWLKSEDLID